MRISWKGWMGAAIVALCTACVACSTISGNYPEGLHWFRDSAEQRAVYQETYRAAGAAVRSLSRGLPEGSWGVILDVDETVLDNSGYQKQLALTHQSFDSRSWSAWVEERRATALPGARAFVDTVLDQLHGQVVFVTNRKQAQCAATMDNLRRASIRYSRILCDAAGTGDKNSRFRGILAGGPATAPLNVLVWIGDNIEDFPGLSQKAPSDLRQFGVRYFALPNPMYGSWERSPIR